MLWLDPTGALDPWRALPTAEILVFASAALSRVDADAEIGLRSGRVFDPGRGVRTSPRGRRVDGVNRNLDGCGHGEVPEWLKGHAWNACVLHGTVGSNPTLSALVRSEASCAGSLQRLRGRKVRRGTSDS